MEDKFKDQFCRLHESLDENTALLVRIDEQMKFFKSKVDQIDGDMRDVKKHVDTMRAFFRVVMVVLTASATLAGIVRIVFFGGPA